MAKTKRITDMTQGSPLAHIITFTMPLLVGNLFQQFYNLVDSIVVGNYVGADALAAVGTCGSLGFLFFSLSSGLAVENSRTFLDSPLFPPSSREKRHTMHRGRARYMLSWRWTSMRWPGIPKPARSSIPLAGRQT